MEDVNNNLVKALNTLNDVLASDEWISEVFGKQLDNDLSEVIAKLEKIKDSYNNMEYLYSYYD